MSNFACYGTTVVTTAAEAAVQAATPACQNVGRLPGTGTAATTLLSYANLANIGTAGVDVEFNWIAQLSDLGLKAIPGAISFNSQDTFLDYYRTKNSPGSFDVTTDWKDSIGPALAGTNGGAYGYRLNMSIGYVLPAVSVNLRWRFLPSVNTVSHAQQQAIIANDAKVAAGGAGTLLSYVPDTTIAASSWNAFDLSFNWNINKTFSLRGGINNLMDKDPAITGATTGFPVGTNLNSGCAALLQRRPGDARTRCPTHCRKMAQARPMPASTMCTGAPSSWVERRSSKQTHYCLMTLYWRRALGPAAFFCALRSQRAHRSYNHGTMKHAPLPLALRFLSSRPRTARLRQALLRTSSIAAGSQIRASGSSVTTRRWRP